MSFKNINKESYTSIADEWAHIRRNGWIPKPILEWEKKLPKASKILDIGCGTGEPIGRFLSEKGHFIHGVDISQAMIDIAIKNDIPNITYCVSDIMKMDTNIKFDGILAWDSLFHLDLEDQYIVFDKLRFWLKPKGYLLFSHGNETGTKSGEMMGQPFHYSALETQELTEVLNKAGLEIIKKWEPYIENDSDRSLVMLVKKEM